MVRFVTFFQGIYYLVTGLWPILHINSFMMVTGYKTEQWLVKMVGALTVSISLLLITIALRRKMAIEDIILILSACISYAAIDIAYSLTGTISIIYLADAFIEILILIFWTKWLIQRKLSLR
jgi:hypothetical protein